MDDKGKWLSQVEEEIIDPKRAIVDPHHHLWRQGRWGRYLLDDLWADTGSGHWVERTVFVECSAEYLQEGAEELRPVGETEFVAQVAAQAEQGPQGAARIRGIVGFADLMLGADVEKVLQAHLEVGAGLFRGIRHAASWDASPELKTDRPPHLYLEAKFREGFACLGRLGLSFDAWNFHPQIPELAELARAFPDTTIILDHFGGPLGIGPYSGKRDEVFEEWKKNIEELSLCPNVVVKLGGLAQSINGFGWHERERPPSSDEIVEANRPYYLHAIEKFGPDRCMFESNFSVEKLSVSYHVLWNAFKKIVAEFSEAEKEALFSGTAARVYRLESVT